MLELFLTAAAIVGFKWVFRNLLHSMIESIENFFLRVILNFFLPAIISFPLLIGAKFTSCSALANLLILAAIIFGDLVGILLVWFMAPLLAIPIPDISWVIVILVILAILQLVLPLLLPGVGNLISLVINIIQVLVLAGLIQANLAGLKECGPFMIPGLGIGLGA